MNNKNIVDQLKSQGYKLTINHLRISTGDFAAAKVIHNLGVKNWAKIERLVNPTYMLRSAFSEDGHDISPRGGKTEVIAVAPDGQEFYGEAHCSLADNYRRNDGITKALGRLLSVLKELN